MKDATVVTETPSLPKNFRYRDDNGKMISKEDAKARRWAQKDTGLPTKIYEHRMAVREAIKNGTDVPVRTKKSYVPGSLSHAGIPSPYDLNRRSGYRTIFQVLAENVGQVVTVAELHAQVNARLAEESPEWYGKNYSETPYDVEANAYVMTRAPYNEKIEALSQRVSQTSEGFILNINVTEPRAFKKRGRKIKEATPEIEANVEADNDNAVTVVENAEVPVEVTA